MTELHHHNRIHALEVELGFFLFLTWSIKFIQMSVCVCVCRCCHWWRLQ